MALYRSRRTFFCKLLAVILLAISSALSPVWATSFTTDQSDLWWNPNESGWGMQLVHRGSVIFATMFVYDPSRTPIWYVATLGYAGNLVWTGDLLLTSGPWFGAVPFNPTTVSFRKVGSLTWTADTVSSGTLNYSVDGVFVTKNLVRQLLVYDDFNGAYRGATHEDISGCFNPAFNGAIEQNTTLNITQSGTAVTVSGAFGNGGFCRYNGTFSQAGQMGQVDGSYSCNSGDFGSFTILEMQVNISGVTARLIADSNPLGCHVSGWLGGMRSTF